MAFGALGNKGFSDVKASDPEVSNGTQKSPGFRQSFFATRPLLFKRLLLL